MAPNVTVLQLDTAFPRVPGDVGCPDSYLGEIEIITVKGATVGTVVSDRPDLIDVTPYEEALARAKGEVVVTSCGFLSYWQSHLEKLTQKPFISSALTALDRLSQSYSAGEVLILTFDAARLNGSHLGQYADYASGIVGLPEDMHLRQVIGGNLSALNEDRVAQELSEFLRKKQRSEHKHLLLECTNLPPYKATMAGVTQLPITDILTQIEFARTGTVRPEFLT